MNEYNKLYQSLVKIKQDAEINLDTINRNIDNNVKELTEIEIVSSEIETQLEDYNERLSIIQGYKKYKRKHIIKSIKWGCISFCAYFGGISLIELINFLITKQPYTINIVGSFIIIGISSGLIATTIYKEETKKARKIYEEEKKFPFMTTEIIKSLTKDLEKNKEKQNECVALLEENEAEKLRFNNLIEVCDEYISYLLSRIPEVSCICRRNIEAMNEVYENDEDIEEIVKLVRSVNNK